MTHYQPLHTSGKTGPVFPSAAAACLWIIGRDDLSGWDFELIRLPAPSPIAEDAYHLTHFYGN